MNKLKFCYISSISVKGFCRLKRIFALKQSINNYCANSQSDLQEKESPLLPKAIALPINTFNIDVNLASIQFMIPTRKRYKVIEDRSTTINTPATALSTKYSRRVNKIYSVNKNKARHSHNTTTAKITSQQFEYQFKASGDENKKSKKRKLHTSVGSRGDRGKFGRRVIQSKNQEADVKKKYRGYVDFNKTNLKKKTKPRKHTSNCGQIEITIDALKQKLKNQKHEIEREMNNNSLQLQFLKKKRKKHTSISRLADKDFEDFQELEQDVENRFSSTANQAEYFKTEHGEEIEENIINDQSLEEERENSEFNQIRRLDEYIKQSPHLKSGTLLEVDNIFNEIINDNSPVDNQRICQKTKAATMKDISNYIEDLLGEDNLKFKPFTPSASNLIDLISPQKQMPVILKNDNRVEFDFANMPPGKEKSVKKKVRLEYDFILDCYYNPETKVYHKKRTRLNC